MFQGSVRPVTKACDEGALGYGEKFTEARLGDYRFLPTHASIWARALRKFSSELATLKRR